MTLSPSLSLIKLWKSDIWGPLDYWTSQHPAAHQVQVGRKNPKPEIFSSALSELSDLHLTVMGPATHQVQVGGKNHKPERFSSALALSELRQNSSR